MSFLSQEVFKQRLNDLIISGVLIGAGFLGLVSVGRDFPGRDFRGLLGL